MMGDNVGTKIELEISNVAHGGVMVSRHKGRVVFVSDAIPGETVTAIITDDSKQKFWRADAVDVLVASEHRQPHVWSAASIERPPAERAGGAEFGHIALSHQRELKRRVLEDALDRMAKITRGVVVEELPGAADGTGWRTRVRLHVAEDGAVGPFAARSHRVVHVRDLPLATRAVSGAAPLGSRVQRTAGSHIDIVGTSTGDVLVLTENARGRAVVERVGDREFQLDARGFWQVHEHAALALTTAVQGAIDPNRFDASAPNLDLYGGVGLFAAAVADRFDPRTSITSVESDARATGFAATNLAACVGAVVRTARVDRFLSSLGSDRQRYRSATVILDPPRSGAGTGVIRQLAALRPAQLVYVACDPVALARDTALLIAADYHLTSVRAFDFFPNTHHLEAVAHFVRN